MIRSVIGAIGFLTRIPVGTDERSWDAFRSRPVAFPIAGVIIGVLLAGPVVMPAAIGFSTAGRVTLPPAVIAAAFVAWPVLLTGVTHLDGLADWADGLAVHGDREPRRAAMTDPGVGAGGAIALGSVIVGLALAGFALARLGTTRTWPAAIAIVIAAEVGAKTAMGAIAVRGSATHDGLGSAMTGASPRGDLVPVLLVGAPAALLTGISPIAPAAFLGALGGGVLVARTAAQQFGGVSGDVFGAANEVGRVVGLHAGVIAWTLS